MSQFWFELKVCLAGMGIGFIAGLIAGIVVTVFALGAVRLFT